MPSLPRVLLELERRRTSVRPKKVEWGGNPRFVHAEVRKWQT
jgi:hypothetical protein